MLLCWITWVWDNGSSRGKSGSRSSIECSSIPVYTKVGLEPQNWIGLKSLGVGAPKCRTTAKQSWCSGGWSLTEVQVGAWQLFTLRYILILYLFHCTVLSFNKSINSSCWFLCYVYTYTYLYMLLEITRTIKKIRNTDSPPPSVFPTIGIRAGFFILA